MHVDATCMKNKKSHKSAGRPIQHKGKVDNCTFVVHCEYGVADVRIGQRVMGPDDVMKPGLRLRDLPAIYELGQKLEWEAKAVLAVQNLKSHA